MSTPTQGPRSPTLRGYRRRKAMLDLNSPPNENRDQEGTSAPVNAQETQVSQQPRTASPGISPQDGQPSQQPPATIDVETLDDDVVESSAGAFAEAKNNAQRTRGRALVVDVDSGRTSRLVHNQRNKRRRVQSNPPVSSSHTIINCDLFINLEGSSSSTVKESVQMPVQPPPPLPPPPPPPPPPKEPTFNCPICMGPLVEETSTKCGHIFCKKCIKIAVATQSKCPTCRKRVTARDLLRVFLPATSSV